MKNKILALFGLVLAMGTIAAEPLFCHDGDIWRYLGAPTPGYSESLFVASVPTVQELGPRSCVGLLNREVQKEYAKTGNIAFDQYWYCDAGAIRMKDTAYAISRIWTNTNPCQ